MLLLNAMVKGLTQPIEMCLTGFDGMWELLQLFERDSQILQYTIIYRDGPITDLNSHFGWIQDFPKLVGTFNWRKNEGMGNPHVTVGHVEAEPESKCIYGSELCPICK